MVFPTNWFLTTFLNQRSRTSRTWRRRGSHLINYELHVGTPFLYVAKNMPSETTSVVGPSILDLLGLYPALLAVAAVLIGISAIAVRKSRYNAAAGTAIMAIGLLGFGATAWRLFRFNGLMREGGGADPGQWMGDFGVSWMAAGVVLPACGIGLLFLCISILLTKTDKPNQ